MSRIEGVGRSDSPEIATEVIREALVNAVMHRDYSPASRGTQIQVELFPDRLEVRSPGGLFGNVRPESLGEAGTSSSRNALLAARLMEVGDPITGRPIAENRGSGLTMIIAEVRRATQTVPVFQTTLDGFRVTIPRAAPVTQETVEWAQQAGVDWGLSFEQVGALAAAKAGYAIDAAFLRRMGLDIVGSRRQLAQLAALNLLTPVRVRQGGHSASRTTRRRGQACGTRCCANYAMAEPDDARSSRRTFRQPEPS